MKTGSETSATTLETLLERVLDFREDPSEASLGKKARRSDEDGDSRLRRRARRTMQG